MVVIGAEAADALYEHLVDGAHDGVAAGLSNPIEKTRGANEGRTRSPRRGRLSVRAGEATGGAIRAGDYSARVTRSDGASAKPRWMSEAGSAVDWRSGLGRRDAWEYYFMSGVLLLI